MTEYWKSHAMHYCELCKVWLNDNPATKATHENGLKHKENVAKREWASRLPPAFCGCMW